MILGCDCWYSDGLFLWNQIILIFADLSACQMRIWGAKVLQAQPLTIVHFTSQVYSQQNIHVFDSVETDMFSFISNTSFHTLGPLRLTRCRDSVSAMFIQSRQPTLPESSAPQSSVHTIITATVHPRETTAFPVCSQRLTISSYFSHITKHCLSKFWLCR